MNKKIKKLRVKLVKSKFGRIKKHRACITGIGLKKINQVVELDATPENLGMVNKIRYLVNVEELLNETQHSSTQERQQIY